MCSVRHGQLQQEDGKAKLFASCPFAQNGTPAVLGDRVWNVVAAGIASAPIAMSRIDAKPQDLPLASTSFLPNSKRGPPSISRQS